MIEAVEDIPAVIQAVDYFLQWSKQWVKDESVIILHHLYKKSVRR